MSRGFCHFIEAFKANLKLREDGKRLQMTASKNTLLYNHSLIIPQSKECVEIKFKLLSGARWKICGKSSIMRKDKSK